MKKNLTRRLALCMLILSVFNPVLSGCARQEADVPTAVPQALTYEAGNVPASETASDSAAPLLHAVLLAMMNRNVETFHPEEPELGWEIVYNMLSLYGQLDARSEYQGEDLLLPSETVRDYAAAAIPNFAALGELPEFLDDRMIYQADTDSYLIACGEESQASLRVSDPSWENGVVCLTGGLIYEVDGSTLQGFRAELVPTDGMVGFSLRSMELTGLADRI